MKWRRFGDRSNPLVRFCLICAALVCSGPGFLAAGDDLSSEPFTVFVAREKTYARCGPSDEYYRTDALRHGQQLEVYLETDDGWLGIRPPESSFCWVPASAIEIAKGGETATVIEDRTVSWIGTHLGRARKYRWQVQMAEGEQLTILGRSERDGPDGPQTWLRIVPPSGEFRWVHRDQIVDSAEELVATLREQSQGPENDTVATQSLVKKKPKQAESGLGAIVHTANSIKNRLTGNPGVDFQPTGALTQPAPAEPARKPTLAVTNDLPTLKAAPTPRSQPTTSQVVGSGLSQRAADVQRETIRQPEQIPTGIATPVAQAPSVQQTQPAEQAAPVADASVAASTEFIGRPRLLDIGGGAAAAPQNNVAAADSNWVVGVGRLGANGSSVQPAAFVERSGTHHSRAHTVSAASIHRVAAEVRDADVDQLQLLLSRLMARGASAAETEPVVTRARHLALNSQDSVTAGRARLVAERAQQYQRVARRRDGNTVIRENGIPVMPATETQPVGGTTQAMPAASGADTHTGFLVQVYSSRPNSPPFALTDHAGNTTAYVTPSPGINIRGHLNSHVKVIGRRGFLPGLNMPHLLVSQAVRTPE